jgi:signal transduction histidine kinase
MSWPSLWIGVSLGVVLTIPWLVLATRRTERRVRHLTERARAAERLAELGQLTGGLAHEIKNPLSSVGLNIQLIQEDLRALLADPPEAPHPSEPPAAGAPARPAPAAGPGDRLARVRHRMDALARETLRLRHILDDFLRFAGRVRLERQPTDIAALVRELIDFFSPQLVEAKVRLRTLLPDQPLIVWVDPGLLKQALLNLLINATQAITDARSRAAATAESGTPGGESASRRDSTTTGPGNAGGEELILRLQRLKIAKQEWVQLHVIDTGPGIEPQHRDQIFQPYFSTKRGGTGLGLPTTRRIVEEHGGTIAVHSEPGKGSDFVLTLPVGPPATPAPDPAR